MLLVVALHRVGIAHQHHRSVLIVCAKSPNHGQHLNHADAQRQGSVAGFLDHRTIGAGVRKGHAQLNDVRPTSHHRMHQLGCDVGEGIASGDIGDQGLAPLAFQRGKGCANATHAATPTGLEMTILCSFAPFTDCPWQLGRQ